MRASIVALVCTVGFLGSATWGAEETPKAIFEKVAAKYASMQTYSAEGTVVTDMDSGGGKSQSETKFSIRLKKPNLYLISWSDKTQSGPGMSMSNSGAVWNAGKQAYLYMGPGNCYEKAESDAMALAGATGISGGAAHTIPSLFFPSLKLGHSLFARFIDPKLERNEKVDGEECYVIGGSTKGSKRETFWISKERHLILKHSRSLEPPERSASAQAEYEGEMKKAVEQAGIRDETTRQIMRDALKRIRDLKGTSVEAQRKTASPKLSEKDFEFRLPADAKLSHRLFPNDPERQK
jgi:hypothetical protein